MGIEQRPETNDFIYRFDDPREKLQVHRVHNELANDHYFAQVQQLDDDSVGPFPDELHAETFSHLLKNYVAQAQAGYTQPIIHDHAGREKRFTPSKIHRRRK